MAPFEIFVGDKSDSTAFKEVVPDDLRRATIKYDPHSKTWDVLDSIFKDWAASDPASAAVCLDLLFLVPHPAGGGKNLRARHFPDPVFRVTNIHPQEPDEDDTYKIHNPGGWGRPLNHYLRQYHKVQ